MPAEIQPPELARVVDFAERSRVGDWSLRAALCRYAQPHPRRVGDVLELVRRVDAALHPHQRRFEKEGPAVWELLQSGSATGADAQLAEALTAAAELDALGEALAAWAVDRHGSDPGEQVDAVVTRVAQRLDAAGVPREERVPPPGARSRGRG